MLAIELQRAPLQFVRLAGGEPQLASLRDGDTVAVGDVGALLQVDPGL